MLGRVVVVSLEPWDEIWRRNQHLSGQLVRQGLCSGLTFIEPPARGAAARVREVEPGIRLVKPALAGPRRLGALHVTAVLLRRSEMRDVDALWINEPRLGRALITDDVGRVAYDVTDDWRTSHLKPRVRRAFVAAEDALAQRAATIVCSETLRARWHERYGVDAAVVHNGVEVDGIASAQPRALAGRAPHVAYVGTLHDERLDVDLVLELASDARIGTVHLVGPDSLSEASRRRLSDHPDVRLEGAVPAAEVPSWLVSMDALLCPHVVTPFTLSLDAIKSYEYLSTGLPVVATPTSGFQELGQEPTVVLRDRNGFTDGVAASIGRPRDHRPRPDLGWGERAREFARALGDAERARSGPRS